MWTRKATWIAVGAAVVAVALVVALLALQPSTGTRGARRTGQVVCLDPGHGGRETGAVHNGVTEKDANLDIALRARTVLEQEGYHVVMTRETDMYVSLKERCAIANASHAAAFVSIHNNARPTAAQGTTTFCTQTSPEGRKLATSVLHEVVDRIHRPDRGVETANYYVLRNTSMPATLLEGVFLTDTKDAALLKQPAFRQQIAEGVAAGADDFLRSLPQG